MWKIFSRISPAWRYLMYGIIPEEEIAPMSPEEWAEKHRPDPILEAITEDAKQFIRRYHDERRTKISVAGSWKSILDSDDKSDE